MIFFYEYMQQKLFPMCCDRTQPFDVRASKMVIVSNFYQIQEPCDLGLSFPIAVLHERFVCHIFFIQEHRAIFRCPVQFSLAKVDC
jgi:hypothetical protein